MTRFLHICIILMLAFILPQNAHAAAEDIQAASRSVVRVAVMSEVEGGPVFAGHGSGVVVSGNVILTNAHVVEEANYDDTISFLIIPSEGSRGYKAKLKAWSPENDLALLELTEPAKLTPAVFFQGRVADGANVTAIGYPANVDVALQQMEADTLRPQAAIKTRGSISAGRSSKLFETLLHTAPIAPGNSGGPIVDNCGRVLGINSFGSTNSNGGSNFYFAVAVKEIITFLRGKKIKFKSVGNTCRSAAEISRLEAEREAAARAKIAAEREKADDLRRALDHKKRRRAEYTLIERRENRMALAALLLTLSLFAGGIGYAAGQRGHRNILVAGTMSGIGLFLLSILTFLLRPSFDQVEELMRSPVTAEELSGDEDELASSVSGQMACTIQPELSRITISNDADVRFGWEAYGCVNKRTQYAEEGGIWSRSFVPNDDAQVSIVSFNPAKNNYRIERYLMGSGAMAKAREARARYRVRGCSADPDKRKKVMDMNVAIRDLLPDNPNETLVFACTGEGD